MSESPTPVWLTTQQLLHIRDCLETHPVSRKGRSEALEAIKDAYDGRPFRTFNERRVLEIITHTAEHFGVTNVDIFSASREHRCAVPRALAMFLARRHTALSYPHLARLFQRKDHTTVMSAYNRTRQKLKTNGDTVSHVLAIEARIAKEERKAS